MLISVLLIFVLAVRQGRYTLTERTRTIMEVKEIQERSMLSAGLDILAEAASQNRAIFCDSLSSCNIETSNAGGGNVASPSMAGSSASPAPDGDHSYNNNESGHCETFSIFLTKCKNKSLKEVPAKTEECEKESPFTIPTSQSQKSNSLLFNANIDLPRQCWPQILSNLVSAMTNLTPLQTKSKEEIQAILTEGQVIIFRY
jgi:hypothetical protein